MGLSAPAQDHVTPQQVIWQQTYKSVKNHNELDSNFEKLKLAITQHVSLLQRQAQVRVKNWLKKLSEQASAVPRNTKLGCGAPQAWQLRAPHTR